MVQRQPFGAGTVDRLLLERQVPLSPATRPLLYQARTPDLSPPAAPRPRLDAVVAEISAAHRQPLARLLALTRWCSRIPRDYPSPDRSTAAGFYGDFDAYRWGGDEEAVVAKGSPWPQEIARVLAALLRRSGFPARLVFLYRAAPPRLHTVVEAWALGGWAACDPCANRCYVWPHHGYASAADLQEHPSLVDQLPEHGRNPYVDSSYFRTAAVADDAGVVYAPTAYALQPARPEDRAVLQEAAHVFAGAAQP